MQLVSDYINYFRNLAANHVDIGPDQEGIKRFASISLDEALSDLRNSIAPSGICMRLINYTYEIADNFAQDRQKRMQGGFIIAKKFESGDFEAFAQAQADTERVLNEIIDRMIHDSNESHPLWYNSLNTAGGIQVVPRSEYAGDVNYASWLVTFFFANALENCVTEEKWSDL